MILFIIAPVAAFSSIILTAWIASRRPHERTDFLRVEPTGPRDARW